MPSPPPSPLAFIVLRKSEIVLALDCGACLSFLRLIILFPLWSEACGSAPARTARAVFRGGALPPLEFSRFLLRRIPVRKRTRNLRSLLVAADLSVVRSF